MRAVLDDVFGLDLRSLALFRIAAALCLLYDLIVCWSDVQAQFTDDGVLPRSVLPSVTWHYSLVIAPHVYVGSELGECLLFAMQTMFAILLLVGCWTRIASVASWFLLISLQARNPVILQGGDVVLRAVLFWSMFLPLGARFSIDSLRRPKAAVASEPIRVVTAGTAALVVQLCLIYWCSVYYKSDPAWHAYGTAVYDALSLEQFATPIGKWLLSLRQPGLLDFLTHLIVLFETFAPLLVLFPWRLGLGRQMVVCAFILFHISLTACLTVGLFTPVCISAWLALTPTWTWEKVLTLRKRMLARRVDPARPAPPTQIRARPLRGSDVKTHVPKVWLGDGPLAQTIAALFLVYLVLWNLRGTDDARYSRVFPHSMDGIGLLTRLDQQWNMFGPRPYVADGWHVALGVLRNGQRVNLINPALSPDRKPEFIPTLYKDERWRKYLDNIRDPSYANLVGYCSSFFIRDWEAHHSGDESLRTFQLYFMRQDVVPEYGPRTVRPILLWHAIATADVPTDPRAVAAAFAPPPLQVR